jgi:hypothetical protein
MRNNKPLILIIGTLVLLLFLLILSIPISRSNKAKVDIVVGPSTASVTVDGKKVSGNSVYVSKARHMFVATLDGFTTNKQVLNVESDTTVRLLLNPVTEDAKQLLEDHPSLQLDRERIGSAEFAETSREITQKYPYLSKLPISGARFTVSYGTAQQTKNNNKNQAIAIYINASDPGERRNAIKNLVDTLNVDPSSIEIVFEDYKNPFLIEATE